MLCPETWRFTPPKSNYKEYRRNFLSENDAKSIPSVLHDFNYAHLISIVLPNIEEPTSELKDLLSIDCDYYKIEDISLDEFINIEFIEKFIKSGEFSALSINTKLDLDNCVCITPEGVLVLHLDKVSYQELGLEGIVSHFTNQKNKYIIQIKLKDFRSKTQIERIRKSLSERLNKFNLIIEWQPFDENICPSSIAKYFSDLNYSVYLCQPKNQERNTKKITVPVLRNDEESGAEILEWLGMFSLGADLSTGKFNNYVNSYETPDDQLICKNVRFLEWRGFYTKHKIKKIYQYLIKYLCGLSGEKIPWISFYVQGFSDAPVSWNLTENHFFINSENAYVFFMKPNGDYLLCTQLCSNKKHK